MAKKVDAATVEKLEFLRKLFIKRLTEDNTPKGLRRNNPAWNQAIFMKQEDGGGQCFNGTDLSMVLQCFDGAIKDYADGGPKW